MNYATKALRAVTSLYPLNRPRASLLDCLPSIPTGAGTIVGKSGLRYIDYWKSEDAVCRSLFWFGDFDPWVNYTLKRLALPGTNVLDIGANIGATALVLAKSVGRNGRLICFEPMPSNADKLQNNLLANQFDWAQIEPVALSDKTATVYMDTPKNQAGMSRIIDGQNGLAVSCLPFDRWIEDYPGLTFSVCKIDVEGHEDRVFAGMSKSMDRIVSFVFERHNSKAGDPLLDLLTSRGFKIFRIEKGLMKTYFRDIGTSTVARQTTDFVAIRPRSAHLLA